VRDAEVARQAILTTATEQFACFGYAGARMEAIAEQSGYNKALLFHYFSSKEQLYKEVVRCMKDEGARQLEEVLSAAINGDAPLTAEQVRGFIETGVRFSFDSLQARPQALRMLAWELANGWETFKQLDLVSEKSPWAEKAAQFIQRAQAAGFIRADLDPRMLIANVLGMSLIYLLSIPRYEMVFPGADLGSAEARAHAREQIVGLIINGILTHSNKEHPFNET
jgi:TetR/AcrR family transcriptional regulator